MRVEHREIADDDRNRKCDGQHAGEGAQRSDEHAGVGARHEVPVSDSGHGADGPPEPGRDRREVVARVVLGPFGVEDERGEDDDAEEEEEDEKEELVCARLERVDEDLEAVRVPGQTEEARDPEQVDRLRTVVLAQVRQYDVQVEEEGGEEIDDV